MINKSHLCMSEVWLFLSKLRLNKLLRKGFPVTQECGLKPGVPGLWWTHPQSMQADMSTVSWESFPKALCGKHSADFTAALILFDILPD